LGIEIAGQVPTLENRVALLDEELNVRFEGDAQNRMEGIRDGFRELLSYATLRDVSISDLQSMILGNPEIDVEDLIANIRRFDDDRSNQHETIQRLFRALRNMTQDELRQFTRFLTGSPLMPVGGFGTLEPPIKIDAEANLTRLPRSSTCHHTIYLPNYGSEETFMEKLSIAIANNGEMEEN
jgi:E3 ubiquitin-protein ligase TRIP12